MKRICSHLIICAPDNILRNTVIEQDESCTIKNIQSLNNQLAETAHTKFYDGIISSEIVSIQQQCNRIDTLEITVNYQYINLETHFPVEIINPTDKPLLLDFGTNDIAKIEFLLKQIAHLLLQFSIIDIISSCTYYPSKILNKHNNLNINDITQLICWQGINLVTKKITKQISIIHV